MTLWSFLGGHRKTGLFLGVISKFKVYTELAYFWGVANFQLFWGKPDTSDTFLEWGNAWSRST